MPKIDKKPDIYPGIFLSARFLRAKSLLPYIYRIKKDIQDTIRMKPYKASADPPIDAGAWMHFFSGGEFL